MARERGAFPVYSGMKEAANPFILRIKDADEKLYEDMVRFGRRNIALLTIAPTGSVSICTQTTSGIEPAFKVAYTRKRKVNPNDLNNRQTTRDQNGDFWEEYHVFHPKFFVYAETLGISKDQLSKMSNDEIKAVYEKSSYYQSTAADTDYLKKVELQGSVQKWVDHSISVTINLPEDTTQDTVSALYVKAWESGCKGMTVYREGSRSGVLVDNEKDKKKKEILDVDTQTLKRPKELKAEIVRFKNDNEDWVAFIGTKDERPYEIFTGKAEDDRFPIPKTITTGAVIKNRTPDGKKQYDFMYYDADGYEVILRGLSRCFNPEFWNYAKMISALLRHDIPVNNVVNIIEGLNFPEETINSWKNGVIRALKKFIADGTKAKGQVCPQCGEPDTMEFKEGCLTCVACSYSKCG
jgi:ribonucleoside-diphosphate reductase alpha chain